MCDTLFAAAEAEESWLERARLFPEKKKSFLHTATWKGFNKAAGYRE